jgi:hypothetical protein
MNDSMLEGININDIEAETEDEDLLDDFEETPLGDK